LTEACRPFDRRRNGLVLSEGGYALVIEEDQLAASRNATPLAELTGFANGFVGSSKLNDDNRLSRTSTIMKSALTNASLSPNQIDLVHTAANGTEKTDSVDAKTLNDCFGNDIPPVCAIKAQVGEVFGAAGVMQSAVAALSFTSNKYPNLSLPEDPEPSSLSLNKMKNRLVESPQKVIINGLDLSGNYSCLILEKYNQGDSI